MNISTSDQCSSERESGWTTYLDRSSSSTDQLQSAGGRSVTGDFRYKAASEEDNNEDEDLSMVSDASSGPPHFGEDEDCFEESVDCKNGSSVPKQESNKNEKKKLSEEKIKEDIACLDDTASSPVLNFPKGKSALQKHFGFFKSSVSGNPGSGATGELKERKCE
ncbi:hypothetical protein U1Q18_016413 [Sarracenia purpurea var. burkii]